MKGFAQVKNWFRNLPIRGKLYITVGIMALLIAIELLSLWFSLSTLSAVRAYVGGEGLYSKAQKDAVIALNQYVKYHDEADYEDFKNFLKISFGDNKARLALDRPNPDKALAREGFLEGGNHPDDIDGIIRVFLNFRHVYYIDKAIQIWAEADPIISSLLPIGEEIHREIKSGDPDQAYLDKLMRERVDSINQTLTVLENEFSYTLGEGSRWLENLVLKLLIAIALTVELSGLLLTISVSRSIERGVGEVSRASSEIARGNLKARAKIYSRDEIGQLAVRFNRMAQTLEMQIQERIKAEESLVEAKDKAEQSENAKQHFLANMSHEIRTPMNAILGFARLMEDTELSPEQQEYMQAIVQSGDHLLVILNEILDFSKLEAGKIEFEDAPIELKGMLNSTLSMFRHKAAAKNLLLNLEYEESIPEILIGDPVRLNQIFINLISNAVKFTKKGEVGVRARLKKKKSGAAILEMDVYDTGIGIPKEKQERIFESFSQASGGITREFGGSGLGLTIVKQLVELMGGGIQVQSTPNKGSTFTFTLPLKISTRKKFSSTQKAYHGMSGHSVKSMLSRLDNPNSIRILLAEDNPVNQLLATRVISKWGFSLDLAEDGQIALEKFKAHTYDMVLMDLQMPNMDGYEATRQIRKIKGPKGKVPIIAMTAHALIGERERCKELGMNDYISKPFDPEELCALIVSFARPELV